jgi:hypothetical protein
MSEREGILRMMASGQWAVYRPGRVPVEITPGDLFRSRRCERPAAHAHGI